MARGSRRSSTSSLGLEGRTNYEVESYYMVQELEVVTSRNFSAMLGVQKCGFQNFDLKLSA
jgi:hypothetical protein